MKIKKDPKVLNKALLDPDSEEENWVERNVVFIKSVKTKPKNINKKLKKSKKGQLMDVHPKPDGKQMQKIKNVKEKRIFVDEEEVRWPNKVIPYIIDLPTFSPEEAKAQSVIEEAVQKFNQAGCVTWVPRTNQNGYIRIKGDKQSCDSLVGTYNWPDQPLHLYKGYCLTVETTLHEMMHAAGSMHEQSRLQDREFFISTIWPRTFSAINFFGYQTTNAREYDLGSVLQYNLYYFTLVDPDLSYLVTNSHSDLSFNDKAELNSFYGCADSCNNPPVCQNTGFVKQSGGTCSCVCPEGLTGADCSQVETSPGCGGVIDMGVHVAHNIVLSPYNTGTMCTWLFKGAEKTRIDVVIHSLDLPVSTQNACFHALEIRDYLPGSPGKLVCGQTDFAYFKRKRVGPQNMMIIRFDSATYSDVTPGSGFNLTVRTLASACTSSPCKYPATWADGYNTTHYSCYCENGYSGRHCDEVEAGASVWDSFEDDLTTLMRNTPTGSDMIWSVGKEMTTPSEGYVMAELISPYVRSFPAPGSIAKMETSVRFKSGDRCLRFQLFLSYPTGTDRTSLKVLIKDGSTVQSTHSFTDNTGNKWREVSIDLPAVDNLKVEFEGVYGNENLAIDRVRVQPQLCSVLDPCESTQCVNGDCTTLLTSSDPVCVCAEYYSGDLCETHVCDNNDCQNGGVCVPETTEKYHCDCPEQYSGLLCKIHVCANHTCVNGDCLATSSKTWECRCYNGWKGQNCDIEDIVYKCNFELIDDPDCFLVEDTNDDFDFTRYYGSTPDRRTGPSYAWSGSYYKYTEASGRSPGDVASLISNVEFSSGPYCLYFYLHTYGSDIGSIFVIMRTDNGAEEVKFSSSGPRDDFWWRTYNIALSLDPTTQVLDVINQSVLKGDKLVDLDFDLLSKPCIH